MSQPKCMRISLIENQKISENSQVTFLFVDLLNALSCQWYHDSSFSIILHFNRFVQSIFNWRFLTIIWFRVLWLLCVHSTILFHCVCQQLFFLFISRVLMEFKSHVANSLSLNIFLIISLSFYHVVCNQKVAFGVGQ